MIKEIEKTIIERIKICDFCKEPAQFTCVVCYKDTCGMHNTVISANGSSAYLCPDCAKRPVQEVMNKLLVILQPAYIPIQIQPTIINPWVTPEPNIKPYPWTVYRSVGGGTQL